MAKFNVEQAQNVEQSKKIPCCKSLEEQLEIMELYTDMHRKYSSQGKERREIECLKVIFPRLFRPIEAGDLMAGRLDFLPIGFGCVTSLGGVGHYCVFRKLRQFQQQLPEKDRPRIDRLYDYWLDHDVKTQYNKETLTDDTLGMFIDTRFPMIATARLSGMMLDYPLLLDNGIDGLRQMITKRLAEEPQNAFLKTLIECLDLFVVCAEHLRQQATSQRMADALETIKTRKPETFVEALQLFWLYALLAGVINYGRLDDFLGPYLAADLEAGRLTDEEAYEYVKSLWTLMTPARRA